tara:strand:+ start:972 stop:1622 length:651 start_codon:yes stop_codon:yes gene_type:complete
MDTYPRAITFEQGTQLLKTQGFDHIKFVLADTEIDLTSSALEHAGVYVQPPPYEPGRGNQCVPALQAAYIEKHGRPICTTQQYSEMYTTVYTMCTQKPPHNHTVALFQFLQDESAKVAYLFKPGSMKRCVWIDFFFHLFRYIDKIYVKRMSYPELYKVIDNAMSQRDEVLARKRRQLSRIPAVIGLIAYWRHLAAMPGAAGMHTAAASFEAAVAME